MRRAVSNTCAVRAALFALIIRTAQHIYIALHIMLSFCLQVLTMQAA